MSSLLLYSEESGGLHSQALSFSSYSTKEAGEKTRAYFQIPDNKYEDGGRDAPRKRSPGKGLQDPCAALLAVTSPARLLKSDVASAAQQTHPSCGFIDSSVRSMARASP